MALGAYVGLLADAVSAIGNFVTVFIYVYIFLIFVHIILTWFNLPYRTWLHRVRQFLADVCEPYLGLYRRFLPPLGPLDLSPIVAVVVLVLIERVIGSILSRLH